MLVIVRKSTARLHNSKTNLDTYRQIIQDKENLSIKFKEDEDIEVVTNNLLNLIQHAAKEATPNSDPQRPTNNIPFEIKKLVAETHTTDSRRKYNRISNKLKLKFQEMRNESFEKYVSKLKREDNSVWKLIKSGRKPKTTSPPISKYSAPPEPWAKSDKEKAEIFTEYLSEVSLCIIMIRIRKWDKT